MSRGQDKRDVQTLSEKAVRKPEARAGASRDMMELCLFRSETHHAVLCVLFLVAAPR